MSNRPAARRSAYTFSLLRYYCIGLTILGAAAILHRAAISADREKKNFLSDAVATSEKLSTLSQRIAVFSLGIITATDESVRSKFRGEIKQLGRKMQTLFSGLRDGSPLLNLPGAKDRHIKERLEPGSALHGDITRFIQASASLAESTSVSPDDNELEDIISISARLPEALTELSQTFQADHEEALAKIRAYETLAGALSLYTLLALPIWALSMRRPVATLQPLKKNWPAGDEDLAPELRTNPSFHEPLTGPHAKVRGSGSAARKPGGIPPQAAAKQASER